MERNIETVKVELIDAITKEMETFLKLAENRGINGMFCAINAQMARHMIKVIEYNYKLDFNFLSHALFLIRKEWDYNTEEHPFDQTARYIIGDKVFEAIKRARDATKTAQVFVEQGL